MRERESQQHSVTMIKSNFTLFNEQHYEGLLIRAQISVYLDDGVYLTNKQQACQKTYGTCRKKSYYSDSFRWVGQFVYKVTQTILLDS